MKAKLIDKQELKKSPMEREAERLLRRLSGDKAIEVYPDGTSVRTIRRAFSKAATNLAIDIQLSTKEDKVYVVLRQGKEAKT